MKEKIEIPMRIIELAKTMKSFPDGLYKKGFIDDQYRKAFENVLNECLEQNNPSFKEDSPEIIYLKILHDLFVIYYYATNTAEYYYPICDEKFLLKFENFNRFSEEKQTELKNLIKKISISEFRKFNRLVYVTKKEWKELNKSKEIQKIEDYKKIKVLYKVNIFSDEKYNSSEDIRLGDFTMEAREFLYPKEISTYYVVF